MLAKETKRNWLIDAVTACTGLLAGLSGLYFLVIPSGGYQGGRNPLYGITVLFERATWDDLHTWTGVFVIIAVAIHLTYHWHWVVRMAKKTVRGLLSRDRVFTRSTKINLLINLAIGVSFLVTALSGMYFLIAPAGGQQGGQNTAWDPAILFSRTTWDLIHTWAGVVLGVAAILHFAIHWRWAKNVTIKLVKSLGTDWTLQKVPATRQAN
jgi:hypothetical protein